jgi:phage terminase small subunit
VATDIRQQDLFPKEAPTWHAGLTGRRRRFVEYYCTSKECFLNATAAYVKAYGSGGKELSDSSVQSNASRMMRDPKIKDAVARLLRANQNEEDQITEYQVLSLLKTLATYNTKDIIDDNGNLKKSLEDLGPLALCVEGIKKTKHGKEIKLYDRAKAFSIMCNYLRLTRPEEGATVINPVVYLTEKDVETDGERKPKGTPEAQDAEYEMVEA